jgi:hypothetical protein
MRRVLKPGGLCFLYVPFLFYYHAETGYYKDYWRFTKDGVARLCEKFSDIKIQSVRGATETWLHISPLGRVGILKFVARFLDKITGKLNSKQVSGYYALLTK